MTPVRYIILLLLATAFAVLGVAHGSADAVQEVGKEFVAALASLSGTSESKRRVPPSSLRHQALSMMIEAAVELGANAVVGVRLAGLGASGVIAFGTAVLVEEQATS